MKDFPIELVKVFEALSNKDCRQILIKLEKGAVNVTEIDREKARPLIYAGMISRWTHDFKRSYYEISEFGKAVLKALSSILNPKVEEEAKEVKE